MHRQGEISLTGRHTLAGLTLVMSPEQRDDGLVWRHRCDAAAGSSLAVACGALFRTADREEE